MSDRFQAAQDRHFAAADVAHFRWTTEDPGFAPIEDALLAPWLGALPFPCLEVGCGEGTNLARLARLGHPIGVDRYPEKARFAARAVPAARLAVADAGALPFRDGCFAGVFIRDVLHHLPEPAGAVAEAVRVLRPGGTFLLIEPNGRNPLVAAQARLVAAERALRHYTPESVRAAVEGLPLRDVELVPTQGLALRRVVLHYQLGLPALGRRRSTAALLERLERLAERILPRTRWAYTVIRARRA